MTMNALWWWIDRWRKSTAYTDMTLEQQGAYRNLLDEASLRGGAIPNDERVLAKACGDAKAWRRLREVMLSRFELQADGWHNQTLDAVLHESDRRAKKQAAWRAKRDNKPGNANGNQPGNNPGSPFPSPSPSPEKQEQQPPPRPLIAGEAQPKTWGKIHGDHVARFCDWVCLPEFLFAEFVRKSAGPEYVLGWAARVRADWEGKTVGDNLKFWRTRWADAHPESGQAGEQTTAQILAAINAHKAARS